MTATSTPARPTHCLVIRDPQAGRAAYAIVYPHSLHQQYATGTVPAYPLDTREALQDRVREAVRERHPEYAEWAEINRTPLSSDVLVAIHQATRRGSDLGLAAARELLSRGDAPWTRHERVDHGTGSQFWCECACQMWAWLGTSHGDKGRRQAGRAAWQEHVETRALTEALAAGDEQAYARLLAAKHASGWPA